MLEQSKLSNWVNWEGNITELADIAADLDINLEPYSTRLIRDYAQRDILTRPIRQGKEAVYGYRQLVELLAARALVKDGWPLRKIATYTANMSHGELEHLIPGQEGDNDALSIIRRLKGEQGGGEPARSELPSFSRCMPRDSFEELESRIEPPENVNFSSNARSQLSPDLLGSAMEAERTGQNFGAGSRLRELEIEPGIRMLVDEQKLEGLGPEDAARLSREIGRQLRRLIK
ncbi:MAG: hypothetical protein V7739_09040 [Motiliproteus sp.]